MSLRGIRGIRGRTVLLSIGRYAYDREIHGQRLLLWLNSFAKSFPCTVRGKKAGKKASAIHKAYGRVSSRGIRGIRGSDRLTAVGSAEFLFLSVLLVRYHCLT